MLRHEEHNTRTAGVTTFRAGPQPRTSDTAVRTGTRLTAGSGRQPAVHAGYRPSDSAGANVGTGVLAERHDWLVPLELS